jgi:hypothetical protein
VDLGGSGLPEVFLIEGAARKDGDGLNTGALRGLYVPDGVPDGDRLVG